MFFKGHIARINMRKIVVSFPDSQRNNNKTILNKEDFQFAFCACTV